MIALHSERERTSERRKAPGTPGTGWEVVGSEGLRERGMAEGVEVQRLAA